MPRPRKTTAALALVGALDRNPGRHADRRGEPKPAKPLGRVPPKDLTEAEAAAWRELRSLAHPGTLSPADGPFLHYAARVLAAVRASPIDAKLGVRLESVLAKLGMTPSDRSRVDASQVKLPGERSPYAEF